MLRYLYRCTLRLHPPAFRRRFGEEMLSIFDHEPGKLSAFGLILDAIVSASRQWALRQKFWFEIPPVHTTSASPDTPLFSSLDPFRPQSTALIHGSILSVALFCTTCFAIRYSWIRVLQIRIPQIQFESYSAVHPATSPGELRGAPSSSQANGKPGFDLPSSLGKPAPHLYVEPVPVEAETSQTDLATANRSLRGISAASGKARQVAVGTEINLRSYAGVYISETAHLKISIAVQDTTLVMTVGDQSSRSLSPVTQTTFCVDGVSDSEVEFAQETGGTFHRLQLRFAGQQITAQRQ